MIGTLISNRYRLEAELGQGGMGVVYRAEDQLLKREVAIKMLGQPNLESDGRDRLLREAQAAARLNHPNIVAIYDAGEANGVPFIVMELLGGQNLHENPPQSIAEIISTARQICSALEHAHLHGIVHRDLKPENVILAQDGLIKLMDFGLARSITSRLSSEGGITGTVLYLAPELILGQGFDPRADLYALGVMLYEFAARRLPFYADDPLAVISQHLYAPVVPPVTYNPGIPASLDSLIVRLLHKDPHGRPASASEVNALLEQVILLEAEAAPYGEPAIPLLSQIVRGRLVGRNLEVDSLRQSWMQTRQGGGQMVLISGEPGVGKTRLASELITHVRLQGGVVLKGGCYEYEAATPYLPLVEALRDWVHAQSPEGLRNSLGTLAAELARLAPEIETRLGPLPPNPTLPPEQERLRLFDSLAQFFQRLAGENGLLLFIDDLHWADHGTLALLHYLLRRLQGDRLLVLAAYREVELDRAHPLAASLVEWNRQRLATRLQLGRLSLAACGTLLASMFGQQQVSEDFTQAIFNETEGNPFFIEEVVKALVEQGQIYRQEGQWQQAAIEELAIPQSIKEAIGRRLDKLTRPAVEIMQHAALIGKAFEFVELSAVAGASGESVKEYEERLLNALDEALNAQLVQSSGGESFVFTHDKIREVLYEELNPIRRRRFHQRTAEGLEKLYANQELETHIQDLAYHFLQSGDLPKSLHYSLAAAENSRKIYAHEEALRYYQHAADSAEVLGDQARLAVIYEAMGSVNTAYGRVYQAVESYTRALGLAETVEERIQLKTQIGASYAQVGDARGLQYLQEAQRELHPEDQKKALAYVLTMLGRYYHYKAEHALAVEYFQQAQKLAETLDDRYLLILIYGFFAGAYQHMTNYKESIYWAEQCIAFGKRENYPFAVATGEEFLAEDHLIMGNWKEGVLHAQQDIKIGEQIGDLSRQAWGKYAVALSLYNQGELVAAQELIQTTLSLVENIGENRLQVWCLALLGNAQLESGDAATARTTAEQAVQRAFELDQVILKATALSTLANTHAALGEDEKVLEIYRQAENLYQRTDNRLAGTFIAPVAGLALLCLGQVEQAQRVIDEYFNLEQDTDLRNLQAVGWRLQAQVYTAQERWSEAILAFDEAIDRLEQLGSGLELIRAYHFRAEMYQQLGRVDLARQDAETALASARQDGAIRLASLAEHLLASLE